MSISIKAVIIGVVLSYVLALVFGLVGGMVAGALLGAEEAYDLIAPSGPGKLNAVLFFVQAITSVIVGYVTARVAGEGELINAVIPTVLCALLGVLKVIGRNPDALPDNLIALAILPFFALLGGLARLQQVRTVT